MTGIRYVRSTQRWLAFLNITGALILAGAVAYVGFALGKVLEIAIMPAAAIVIALTLVGLILWRERFIWSIPRVALWLEERTPELRYALVTAIDPRYAPTIGPRVEPLLKRLNLAAVIRYAALRALLIPFGVFVVAVIGCAVIERGWSAKPSSGRAAGSRAAASINRLASLYATVTPPAYAAASGIRKQNIDEPSTIAGIAGSRVTVTGRGAPDGIKSVLVGTRVMLNRAGPEHWGIHFVIPDSAAVLTLSDGEYRRLIIIAPTLDRSPGVQLVQPARDTTVRTASGTMTLYARIHDDIGVSSARFEYIITTGEGEGNFKFREGVLSPRRFSNGAVDSELRVVIPLSHFQLQPGDQLSVRAVAFDNNDVSGPGVGYSEPRTLRLARPAEYDSLVIEPAPPPADSALMTLRYLIQLTERLEAKREIMLRPQFVDSSRALGTRAGTLRFRIMQLQMEHTLYRLFPPNPLLTAAYNALAEGESALKIAEPDDALPHLWVALRALQQYAWAERYYLRGREGDVIVDLERVRLSGKDTGQARPRAPRTLADTTRLRMRQAYADAIRRFNAQPDSALARLMLLQAEALRSQPELAVALGDAIKAIQSKDDARGALQRARRIIDGPIVVTDTLPQWSGRW